MNNKKAVSDDTIRSRLKEIAAESPTSISASVINEALQVENIPEFFVDLQRSGCQSGMINSLIYYHDTHTFFDQHYDEIEELRFEIEDSINEPLIIRGDLKNWLSWFAFEEVAFQISSKFD